MTIDWKKEAEKYRQNMIDDLSELIAIESTRDVEHKTDEYPLGPGVAKALQKVLSFGDRDGFVTKNVENLAGHIEYGEGSETLGVLGHVDEVPAGDGWVTDPFKATIKDGKIYGRGTSDDKGPSLAAYYGLKIIKDLNLPVSKRVRFFFGTDEESNWEGITRYLEVEDAPDYAFSPDAEFPIINGEKGIVTYKITFDKSTDAGIIKSFTSGLRVNMVPQNATAIIDGSKVSFNDIKDSFEKYLADNNVTGEATEENNEIKLFLSGKGSHAMEPNKGVNSATFLAVFLNTLELNADEKSYFGFIENTLHLDYFGEKMNIKYSHDIMGELTSSADIYDYQATATDAVIMVNIRYPKGKTDTEIRDLMAQALPQNAKVEINGHAQPPHFVDADDELVKTLLATYRDHVEDDSEPLSIGGGTYGRMLPRGVAFGGLLPGRENVMHQANEYIVEDDLVTLASIYADAIYRVIK